MARVKTYNPKDVTIIFGTSALSGFSEKSKVKVTYGADLFKRSTGVDGEHTRVKINNDSASIEISLGQSSGSNDYLSEIAALDKLDGSGIRPISIRDGKGTTIVVAKEAWIGKRPDLTYSGDAEERVWVIDTGDADIFIGGN